MRIFGEGHNTRRSRRDVLDEYCSYAERMCGYWDGLGVRCSRRNFMKPLFGIFALETVRVLNLP